MHPDDAPVPPRLRIARNRGGCLFGASWSHHASFPFRLTHFYLGLWVLTLRTGEKAAPWEDSPFGGVEVGYDQP